MLPTLSTTATSASHVSGSPYSIRASGAVDPNYSITYVAGSLTVTAVPLTVTANNATKVYGYFDPQFTASYAGFVNGDSAASLGGTFQFSTNEPTPVTTAPLGPYQITPSGLSSSDYTITYATGTLTVVSAVPTRLVFLQQPAGSAMGSAISPAVTVELLDQNSGPLGADNSDQVTIALGANPGGATLTGTTTLTVSGGVATFSNLSLNQPDPGYTLVANLGGISVTSAAFNVAETIENFSTVTSYTVVGGNPGNYASSTAGRAQRQQLRPGHHLGQQLALPRPRQPQQPDHGQSGGHALGVGGFPHHRRRPGLFRLRQQFRRHALAGGRPQHRPAPAAEQQRLGLREPRRRAASVGRQSLVPPGSRLGKQRHHRGQTLRQRRRDVAANGRRHEHGLYLGRDRLPFDQQHRILGHGELDARRQHPTLLRPPVRRRPSPALVRLPRAASRSADTVLARRWTSSPSAIIATATRSRWRQPLRRTCR